MDIQKIMSIIAGTASVVFGIVVMIKPKLYNVVYHRYFDFTGINIPLGLGAIFLGCYIVWIDFTKPKKPPGNDE